MIIFSGLRGEGQPPPRLTTGVNELDIVAGSGFVLGESVLLSGDPGAGKSTLMLQAAATVARPPWLVRAAYITGEETLYQVQDRAARLYVDDSPVRLAATNDLDLALAALETASTKFLVVDSAQVMTTRAGRGLPGSPGMSVAVTRQLVRFAHQHDCVVVLICHVNKASRAAGPNTLQHEVDAVMHMEVKGEWRALRASKNRFGSTTEVGLFRMDGHGLKGVT
jgi:DNA repair protein RadA/Sms